MTNAEARFNKSLRPRKPEGSLGWTAQDVHLDSHTAPELCDLFYTVSALYRLNTIFSVVIRALLLEIQSAKNGKITNFDIVRLPIIDGTVTRSNITWEWKEVQT